MNFAALARPVEMINQCPVIATYFPMQKVIRLTMFNTT